eukprot:731620-Amphidinium_carterae.1
MASNQSKLGPGPEAWKMQEQNTEAMMKVLWVFSNKAELWPSEKDNLYAEREDAVQAAAEAGDLRTRPPEWKTNTPAYVHAEMWVHLADIIQPLVTVEETYEVEKQAWTRVAEIVWSVVELMDDVQAQVNAIVSTVQPANTDLETCSTAFIDWDGHQTRVEEMYGSVAQMAAFAFSLFG